MRGILIDAGPLVALHLPMDLADAALVRVAERDGLHRILTIDRRDFSIYRLYDEEAFTLLD